VFCSAVPLPARVNVADRAYFRRALETGAFATGDYQTGRITGKATINFGYPVRDARGKTLAVVFAALDLTWLQRMLEASGTRPDSALSVVNSAGRVLAHYPDPEGNWAGRNVEQSPLVRAVLARPGEGSLEVAGLDGVSRLYAYATLLEDGGNSAYVTLGIPESVAYGEVRIAFVRNLTILVVIGLLVTAIAWWGGERVMLRRLRALATAARHFGDGALNARSGVADGRDELGELARAFDGMAQTVEQRTHEAQAASREIERVNRALKTLSAGNRTLLRASEEMELLNEMCRVAVDIGGYRMAWVGYVRHDEARTIEPVAHAGFEEGHLATLRLTWNDTERGRGPSGTAVRNGEPCVIRDVATDPRLAPWREEALKRGYASMICLPLRIAAEVIGIFCIFASETDAFGKPETELLEEMADDIAYGIATLRARRKQQEQDDYIRRMAYTDPVTGLGSRLLAEESLHQLIGQSGQENRSFALLHLDLDHFRDINDAIGHYPGNELLRQVAGRLRGRLAAPATAARLGPDEFGVLLPGADAQQALQTAASLRQALDEPFAVADLAVNLQGSIGIAFFPGHGTDSETLLRHATQAVYAAKRSMNGVAVYTRGEEQDGTRRLALATDLRRAIERGGLKLYCQPKVDIATGQVRGAEALTRWPHERHGLVAPPEFIAIAERTGLIRPLTYWALETSARQIYAWRLTDGPMPLAVNLSVRNLRDPHLLDRIGGYVSTWGLDPQLLELEITENALMEDPVAAREVLARLRDAGFYLYIDDFGTGYSSLGYLKQLPINAIKIDKSFVADMVSNKDSAHIVRSTVDLAHDLDLKVVAEGVEDDATLDELGRLGCDYAQGYLFTKPLPCEEFMGWMRQSPWSKAHA
jgi:diguanylate cyclase (GGDEF)-like protein